MNLKEKVRLRKASGAVVAILSVFFVLSLSLHNHAFYLSDSSVDKVSQSKSTQPNHSKEFCSACRLNGNIKLHDVAGVFDSHSFGVLTDFLNFDVLIPSSFLTSSKSPRSPPII